MTRGRALAALALIAVVFVATRHWLASTPLLSETYYDEALTGLMGLAIFHGAPQVFYWGQPYLGAIEAYVAAAGFWLAGPSTLALRMAEITAAVFWAWSCWSLAGRIGGPWSGLLAGLWIALPPVFLSFAQLSAHGQSLSMTLGPSCWPRRPRSSTSVPGRGAAPSPGPSSASPAASGGGPAK